ncbi:IL-1-beta receptor [Ectromelia virus]|uniref:Interleukin-1-binding protein n=4 Tax=Ectromelia virus TaxID=12643 RepID=Q779M3_9POXV|nr:IL-beta-binding protein [Ectromelia virus]AFH54733.1 IL-1 beta receptor [Ectromelia virus ERPV]AIF30248.1 EVN191 [Ectromelia virus Naval]QSV39757.1 IL1-beta-R [Ectromelia virus WH]AAC99568.1 IL-1 beta binding protein C9R [Ectromelia virus]AUO16326.1 IL-1-beta receptor [Ectromelia virus]
MSALLTILLPIFFYSSFIHTFNNIECIDNGLYFTSFMELEKEPVILPCPQINTLSSGYNVLDIIWEKRGADNDNIIPIDNGTNMLILNPTQTDSGIYICITKNETYCDMMSLNLTIVTDTESNIDLISYPQIVNERSTGEMVCPNINAFIARNKDVDVDVIWRGHPRLRNKRLTQRPIGIITIEDVRKNDAGYYTCVLKYTYRDKTYEVTRIVKLEVRDRIIPPTMQLPVVVMTSLGSNLTIACRVSLRPPTIDADVFWISNNEYYEEDDEDSDGRSVTNRIFTIDKRRVITSRLNINPVKEDDATTFTCMAFTVHNSISKTVTISIK